MIFENLDNIITPLNYEDHIKRVERYVRNSREYSAWVKSVYSRFENIQSVALHLEDIKEADIRSEVHHIITLYDIVLMVIVKELSKKDVYQLSIWQVVDKVLELHLEDKVLCCVLTATEHDMVHMKKFTITKDTPGLYIPSNYKEFICEYKDYLTEEELEYFKSLGVDYEN